MALPILSDPLYDQADALLHAQMLPIRPMPEVRRATVDPQLQTGRFSGSCRPLPDVQRLIFDPQQQTFRFSASCRSEYAVPVRAGYVGSRRKLSVGRRDNGWSQCGYSPPFMAHDALPEDVWGVACPERQQRFGNCRDYLFPWVSIFGSVSAHFAEVGQ
ncbi:hypothetical protein [Sphingomonas bisphenolicum]|uniref:hypothetical protein n=1 Tax=Sphingomonas bisphenolicum TaxID=296544 RepID=UPI0021C2F6F8|nr:hypothetical protein [Sphingomonas bisphenolicum]